MAAGLQVWDANGSLIVDLSTRLGRILGVTTFSSSTGSITDADFASGTPFFIASPTSVSSPSFGPKLTISGTTLSWDFEGRVASAHRLVYGVY